MFCACYEYVFCTTHADRIMERRAKRNRDIDCHHDIKMWEIIQLNQQILWGSKMYWISGNN